MQTHRAHAATGTLEGNVWSACRRAYWRMSRGARRAVAVVALGLPVAQAQIGGETPYVIGRNDWLFVRHEIMQPSLDADVRTSLDIITRFHRVLADQGIALAVVSVPSKMETHSEHLPATLRLPAYMRGLNDSVLRTLRTAGVTAIDLKAPLREVALAEPDFPMFFRLDTHWTPAGAAVAAEAIERGLMMASERHRNAIRQTPLERYEMAWGRSEVPENDVRDLARLVPSSMREYPPETVRRFQVWKSRARPASLLGDAGGGDIVLIGSSFSGEWSGFAPALRFALQRDVFNYSINADVGPWATMRAYMDDQAFLSKRPKLIIWEIPERVLNMPPNYALRAASFRFDNSEWLLHAAATAATECGFGVGQLRLRSSTAASLQTTGTDAFEVRDTRADDVVEFSVQGGIDRQDYLSAGMELNGSVHLVVEALAKGKSLAQTEVAVTADATQLRTPLLTTLVPPGTAIDTIRIAPGRAQQFALKDIRLCRHSSDYLH